MKSNPGRSAKKPAKKPAKKAATKKASAKKPSAKASPAKSGSASRPKKLEGPRFDVAHVPIGGQHAPGPGDEHFRVVDRKAKRSGGNRGAKDIQSRHGHFEAFSCITHALR